MSDLNYKTIPVSFKDHDGYDIHIGSGLLSQIAPFLAPFKLGKNCHIISTPEIYAHYGDKLSKTLNNEGYTVSSHTVPSGESHKTLDTVFECIGQLIDAKLERKDTIIALGGGVVGDVAGFVASTYLRGINLIQVPTSLLAQVDAAIGGKTGVNHPKGKNLIGTFYQPKLVLIDTDTLDTLPKEELLSGLAEVVKYGMILDSPLFDYMESHAAEIKTLTPKNHDAIWQHLIERSAKNKAVVIEKDEKEANLREILNFGHTIGHALEAATHYTTYRHGEAVAIGMCCASFLAHKLGILDREDHHRLCNLIMRLGFSTQFSSALIPDILTNLRTDKKIKDGEIRFILPIKIGATTVKKNISDDDITAALTAYSKD
ncbi:3-dehydroquinate synthase [Candidatus Marinamargulisbacteria bacterium SCGC AG-439-L15]|nr:3-dehydroquinate synthase [Candidatus Marinamargulisbacteria bacterium SCGC AG-439-L15]